MTLPEIGTILLPILIFIYIAAAFEYVDTLLENRRIKKWMLRCLYVVNSVVFTCLFFSSIRHTTILYFIIFLCMILQLILIYKESLLTLFFITSALHIHMMIIRAITLGLFAIVLDLGLYDVNQGNYATATMNVSLAFLALACILCKALIPARSIKIIQQHKDQLVFMTTWFGFVNIYFLFNSLVFTGWDIAVFAKYNVIAVSVAIIFALYTVLFYTMKVGMLLGYKEKSDFLESVIEDEKQYKNSVIHQSILGFEVNLTKDVIVNSFGKYFNEEYRSSDSYTYLIANKLAILAHEDDLESLFQFTSIKNLLENYNNGIVNLSLDLRLNNPRSDSYSWFKISYSLYRVPSADSVMAFAFAKNIDTEKKFELNIKHHSERDALTGLYNSRMIKHLVDAYITEQSSPPYKGVFLIIDIDNFKLINDSFGHMFGDQVLNDIAIKLLSVFRCDNSASSIRKDDDIIGRFGGDEFMVFVKTSDIDSIRSRAQTLCDILKTTYTTSSGGSITVSASVGIAIMNGKEDSFQDLYSKADTALYISKRKGKDCFSFYTGQDFQGYIGDR